MRRTPTLPSPSVCVLRTREGEGKNFVCRAQFHSERGQRLLLPLTCAFLPTRC